MKNATKKIAGFLLLTFALVSMPQEIAAHSETNDTNIIVKDDLVGGWEYTVEDAPEGYEEGFMLIVNQNGVYKVQIELSAGYVNGQNVVLKENKLTFNIIFGGETIAIAVEAKGSKLSGTSTSPSNGVMNIAGIKSISPGE